LLANDKKKIECVIFDFGGVIGLPQQKKHISNMVSLTKMNKGDFARKYFHNRLAYDQGLIDKNEYWKRVVGDEFELNDDLIAELVREDYCSWTKINAQMIRYIKELRNRVKCIVLLSNINFEAKNYIKDDLNMFRYFDDTFCSCDLKLLKPGLQIYEHVTDTLGADPSKCLLIDDTVENIVGAKEFGMQGIAFKDYAQLTSEVEELYELIHN
jgi:putative hydrolase of the HAD superfamily